MCGADLLELKSGPSYIKKKVFLIGLNPDDIVKYSSGCMPDS